MRPGIGVKGRLGGKEGGCRGGERGARAAYSGGRRSSKPQETGCPQVWGKRPQPQGPRAGMELIRDDGLSRPRRRVADRTGRRPGRLSCPEPVGGGLCPRHPPSPGPDVVTAAAARQSHPPGSVGRPSLPAQVGAVDNARRAPQLQDPGTGSGSGAAQGRSPDPRGRHDGLLAAPQRGQSPPPAPPPDDVRCAPRVGTGTLPTPLSGTLRRLSALVPLPSRARPRTTC